MDDNFVPSGSTTTEKSLPRLQKHVQKFLYVSNLPYGLDERAYYDMRDKYNNTCRELHLLQQKYQDSIKQQWEYFNMLKRNGIIR